MTQEGLKIKSAARRTQEIRKYRGAVASHCLVTSRKNPEEWVAEGGGDVLHKDVHDQAEPGTALEKS